jgi:hypothetical protein
MLSEIIGCNGFSWASCPAITELETIMLQCEIFWNFKNNNPLGFGVMIGLPKEFLPFTEHGRGGGVIQVRFLNYQSSKIVILGLCKRMQFRGIVGGTLRNNERVASAFSVCRRGLADVKVDCLLFKGGEFLSLLKRF